MNIPATCWLKLIDYPGLGSTREHQMERRVRNGLTSLGWKLQPSGLQDTPSTIFSLTLRFHMSADLGSVLGVEFTFKEKGVVIYSEDYVPEFSHREQFGLEKMLEDFTQSVRALDREPALAT